MRDHFLVLLLAACCFAGKAVAQPEYVYHCGDNGWDYKLQKVMQNRTIDLYKFEGKSSRLRRINCYKVANGLNKALVQLDSEMQRPILKCRVQSLGSVEVVSLVTAIGDNELDVKDHLIYISGFDELSKRQEQCQHIVSAVGEI
jgi:hypothetical protein